MRKIYLMVALMLGFNAFAQKENVGIGTVNPNQSAVLDLHSSSKGFLMPRMSSVQRNSILNPALGLIIYQTDSNSGFYFYNGNEWRALNEQSSLAADPNDWTMFGNSSTVPGTNFIGTTDYVPFMIKTGNEPSAYIDPNTSRKTFLGFRSGFSNILGSGADNTAIGYQALQATTTGSYNMAIGNYSLLNNIQGDNNVGLGVQTLQNNVDGIANMAIGINALRQNISGSNNIAIGREAGYSSTGSFNVSIGAQAGFSNTGNSSVFIGNLAGYSETSGNKLYISNSSTTMPLVYGDFSAKYVTIGDVTPALRTQGTATGGYNLLVKGGILTEKVKVALAAAGTDWADYVFEPEYKSKMMSLEDVEKFTMKNKHLPNVPSAEEMVKIGLDVSQTSKMFMEKIEELTLYMIELNKEVKALKAENELLKKK